MYFKYAAAALTAVIPFCSAQTYSQCNPLEKSCPPNKGLTQSSYTADFTQALGDWKITAGSVPVGPQGAEFTVANKGDAPTIDTNFYFFFGKAEVVMKAAPGRGIVSSIVLESDDLDEIDWEALGGDTTQIQTNYFGKGDTTTYDRGTYEAVNAPQDIFHTYTIDWTKDYITWAIDGAVVRTLNFNDAQGGTRFPQTPMRLRLGSWAGGDPDNAPGTIEWAGGQTDYSQGPFTMYVKSVHIENTNPAESYTYSDNSGSWQSIQFSGAVAPEPNPPAVTPNPPAPTTTPSEPAPPAPTTASSSSSESEEEPTTVVPQPPSTTLATTTKPPTEPTQSATESGSESTPTDSSSSSTPSGSSGSGSGSGSGSDSGSDNSSSTPTADSPSPSSSSSSTSDSGAAPTVSLFPGAAASLKGSYTGSLLAVGAVAALLAF